MRLKQRRNFLPTLVLATVFWGGFGWLVYSFPPSNNFLLITFYLLLFGAVFLSAALVFANSRRGFLLALLFILLLLFRYHQIANILNTILLVAIFVSLELYFSSK